MERVCNLLRVGRHVSLPSPIQSLTHSSTRLFRIDARRWPTIGRRSHAAHGSSSIGHLSAVTGCSFSVHQLSNIPWSADFRFPRNAPPLPDPLQCYLNPPRPLLSSNSSNGRLVRPGRRSGIAGNYYGVTAPPRPTRSHPVPPGPTRSHPVPPGPTRFRPLPLNSSGYKLNPLSGNAAAKPMPNSTSGAGIFISNPISGVRRRHCTPQLASIEKSDKHGGMLQILATCKQHPSFRSNRHFPLGHR